MAGERRITLHCFQWYILLSQYLFLLLSDLLALFAVEYNRAAAK